MYSLTALIFTSVTTYITNPIFNTIFVSYQCLFFKQKIHCEAKNSIHGITQELCGIRPSHYHVEISVLSL